MTFLNDNEMKNLFLCTILFILLIILFDIMLCLNANRKINEYFIYRQTITASVLENNGVPEEIIAKTLTENNITENGEKIIKKLGIKHSFKFYNSVFADIAKDVILSAFLFLSVILFLSKREKLYNLALDNVYNFNKLQNELTLPCLCEGTLYSLFECINHMAKSLMAKHENEKKTKELLKCTLSDISHQLKTPLAALSMYNEIIEEEPENTDTVIYFTQKSRIAADRINMLIRELLKIARLDSGVITFNKKEYFVKELIELSSANLTERAKCEGKEIITECKDVSIKCDINRTSEAIGNIIKNALDYTETGGKITITHKNTPLQTILYISDNGKGIAEEDLHHIFKRFYKSKNSSDTQGVGLGLSLVKSVIEGQGGTVLVDSKVNKGTIFTIILPK